jgi:hypothetical protein
MWATTVLVLFKRKRGTDKDSIEETPTRTLVSGISSTRPNTDTLKSLWERPAGSGAIQVHTDCGNKFVRQKEGTVEDCSSENFVSDGSKNDLSV